MEPVGGNFAYMTCYLGERDEVVAEFAARVEGVKGDHDVANPGDDGVDSGTAYEGGVAAVLFGGEGDGRASEEAWFLVAAAAVEAARDDSCEMLGDTADHGTLESIDLGWSEVVIDVVSVGMDDTLGCDDDGPALGADDFVEIVEKDLGLKGDFGDIDEVWCAGGAWLIAGLGEGGCGG